MSHTMEAALNAKLVIDEVNEQMPWTYGGSWPAPVKDITLQVRATIINKAFKAEQNIGKLCDAEVLLNHYFLQPIECLHSSN